MAITSMKLGLGRMLSVAIVMGAGGLLTGCAEEEVSQIEQRLVSPTTGAIFTTLVDGSSVNSNIYDAKEDVYLDGGPGMQAPITAAGLPAGDYFFQVTDPSGKDLLSTDHITCRRVTVNDQGVISMIHPGTNYVRSGRSWMAVPCLHHSGLDIDHNAVTVQLMPYDDTPNRGGVYKVWMTPVDAYLGFINYVPLLKRDNVAGENWQPGNVHGFDPRYSKTDNYKVKRQGKDRTPSQIIVKKFHDKNANSIFDGGDMMIEGWPISVLDPLGAGNTVFTTAHIMASAGMWSFLEDLPMGVMQTVSMLDGMTLTSFPTALPQVDVMLDSDVEEMHEVVYGNVGLGSLLACKIFDKNADGMVDDGEPGVFGWPMTLTGTDVRGMAIGPMTHFTGEDGCVSFPNLLPGTYMVEEGNGGGTWMPTGSTMHPVTIESHLMGSTIVAPPMHVHFTNVCTDTVDFGTKGYWHNKNGLTEMTDDAIAFANTLSPYDSASSYFSAGDEPFDGMYSDGTLVSAASGAIGETIAAAGTARAEISHFLIDSNTGGDPREQLAQQLLAFVMNTLHRLGGTDAMILMDGNFLSAGDLIHEAILAWEGNSASDQTNIKDMLDMFNNSDAVAFIPHRACPVMP